MASPAEARGILCVVYAAKSSPDERDSRSRQIEACRAEMGLDGDREVVAIYSEEQASGWSADRGYERQQAFEHAERLAAEGHAVELWVHNSDRLARGDGIQAAHLVEHVLWSRRAGVTLRSVTDNATFSDLIHAVLGGERGNSESSTKSIRVREGLADRKHRGQPVGRLPEGYEAVLTGETDSRGKPITDRRPNPERVAAVVQRAFDMLDARAETGEIARALNAEGLLSRLGNKFTARTVRDMLRNPAYIGEKGYQQVIEREQFERVQAILDERANGPHGGREPNAFYLLRGIVSCARCGDPLYTRSYASGRHYLCRAVRESRGTCDAPPIPADLAEGAVLDHLETFIGDLEAWLQEQASEKVAERDRFASSIEEQRRQAIRSERRSERAHEEYSAALDSGDAGLADTALRALQRIEADHDHRLETIADAEERLAEWPAPDLDDALDAYSRLQAQISGCMQAAHDAGALRVALQGLLADVRLDMRGDRLRADFGLTPEMAERLRRGLFPDLADDCDKLVVLREASSEQGARGWCSSSR